MMKHVVSCSLGKDSVAMLLMMIDKGMKIDKIIWANTSLEFPENFIYKKKLETYINREITVVRPQAKWDDWFYREYSSGKWAETGRIHGFPFVITAGWCCREFKQKPLYKAHRKLGDDCIVYIGYAYDEQGRTLKDIKGVKYKFPLIEWKITELECRNYLEERDILNPLYEKFDRIGCWLCPKQSKRSLKQLWKHYPNLWKQLKKYEADSPHGFRINETLIELQQKWEDEREFNKKQMKLNIFQNFQ